ncbi:hypothetical protein [Streptomyces cucumeris]|uniref:hypothetical protein n=1 Tax=Streptomyces cucumeris TaxID=2962890 RepID=UPI0020C8D752|nr:hypothetical protein [Streptomyces sp. NEAU-Y11]MCP9205553.1 hypothetical protein [Streptomyces sp. NEAU-Y11]
MNGPDHYREAESILTSLNEDEYVGNARAEAIAQAQVHATLAVAAAREGVNPDQHNEVVAEPAAPTPLPVRWDRLVIHPCDPGGETIVCCLAEDGRPVALQLDDEHREALGLQLLDPDGDGETAELTVYRASHESITFGHYATREAAREHCEALVRRECGDAGSLGWIPDDGSDDAPEELSVFGPAWEEDGPEETCTGYVVTPLTVATAYDEDGDE